MPALAAGPELQDGMARTEYHGIPGLFVEWETWRAMMVQHVTDLGALAIALSRAQVEQELTAAENKVLRKHSASMEFRAVWGLPIGIGIGATVSAIVATVLVAVFGGKLQVQAAQ